MNDILSELVSKCKKPNPFQQTENVIWTDPYISRQLLKCHLSQETDAASRRKEYIDNSITHLMKSGYISRGTNLLDLGCGPGLYAESLAIKGVKVTGIDFSQTSIEYAQDSAARKKLDIKYIHKNILELDAASEFDVVIQTYGELNVFSPESLSLLLDKVHKALKKKGTFIFDITTKEHRRSMKAEKKWYLEVDGFWGQGEKLILEEGLAYPDNSAWLDRYYVISKKGTKEFRNWYIDYDLNMIKKVFAQRGYRMLDVWSDLQGSKLEKDSEWLGLVFMKV